MDKVKKANTLLIEQKQNAKFPIFSKIGDADIEIISNFLKWNITEIYTSDKAFYETCKLLGLDSKFISISNYYEMERRL
jgi:hypothetical protein